MAGSAARLLTAVTALLSLAKNGVPIFGVLARDWTAATAMLLYLAENIVLALLGALTVRLVIPASDARGKSLRTFFLIATPFTFGAAVFTAFVVAVRSEYTVDARELLNGLAFMIVFQLIAFAVSLARLRGITLAEAENLLSNVLGRIFLLALAVWIGLLLAFFVSSAFLIPFMILKTIVDVGGVLQRRQQYTA